MPIVKYQRRETIPGRAALAEIPLPPTEGITAIGRGIQSLGEGLEDVANILIRRSAELKRQKDESTFSSIVSAFDEENRTFMLNQLQMTGRDTLDNVNVSYTFRDDMLEKYIKDVVDNEMKLRIENHIRGVSNNNANNLASWQLTQRRQIVEQDIKNIVAGAVKDTYITGNLSQNIINFEERIKTLYDIGSIGAEEAARVIVKGTAEIAEADLDKLIISNPSVAHAMLQRGFYNEYLSKDKLEEYDRKLKPLIYAQEGIRAAIEIYEGSLPDTPINELLRQARERFENAPEELKIVRSELIKMHSADKDAKTQAIQTAVDEVHRYIVSIQLEGRIASISDVPREVWKRLWEIAPEEANRITDQLRNETEQQKDRLERKALESERKALDQEISWWTNWGTLISDPKSLKAANLNEMLVGREIGPVQFRALVEAKEKQDPLKEEFTKLAIRRLNEARTKMLFYGNDVNENNKRWAYYVELTHRYIKNNYDKPDFDPQMFVDKVLEPIVVGRVRRVMDFMIPDRVLEPEELKLTKEKKEYLEKLAEIPEVEGAVGPTLEEFLRAARPVNPRLTDEQLTEFYNKKYGREVR